MHNLDCLEENLPQEHSGFLVAFKAFRNLEDSCFSKELDPFYADRINDFVAAYYKLGLSH